MQILLVAFPIMLAYVVEMVQDFFYIFVPLLTPRRSRCL